MSKIEDNLHDKRLERLKRVKKTEEIKREQILRNEANLRRNEKIGERIEI